VATTVPESATPITDAPKASVLARFTPASGVTSEQYDDALRRLKQGGEWPPAGLEYHVAFWSNGDFRVSEVWESREQMDRFGERLMPVLKDAGIELSDQPETLKIHNIIKR
jgi:hypothetical protein